MPLTNYGTLISYNYTPEAERAAYYYLLSICVIIFPPHRLTQHSCTQAIEPDLHSAFSYHEQKNLSGRSITDRSVEDTNGTAIIIFKAM